MCKTDTSTRLVTRVIVGKRSRRNRHLLRILKKSPLRPSKMTQSEPLFLTELHKVRSVLCGLRLSRFTRQELALKKFLQLLLLFFRKSQLCFCQFREPSLPRAAKALNHIRRNRCIPGKTYGESKQMYSE